MRVCISTFATLGVLALMVQYVRAELPLRTRQELQDDATDIISGKVQSVYSVKERHMGVVTRRFVAAVQVTGVEKSKRLRVNDLVYVRYHRTLRRPANEVGGSGHSPRPEVGQTVRIYLEPGYDIYTGDPDGGYDVLAPNGWQILR